MHSQMMIGVLHTIDVWREVGTEPRQTEFVEDVMLSEYAQRKIRKR